MMHLSRLLLNVRHPEARRDAWQPYELHRTLAHAFPTPDGVKYRAHHGVLLRIEPAMTGAADPVVLVQSRTSPDWSQLPQGYALRADTRPFTPALSTGQTLNFRLAAQPAKKPRHEYRSPSGLTDALGRHKSQGRRRTLSAEMPDDAEVPPALDWLQRKGIEAGFEILQVTTAPVRFGKRDYDPSDKATLPFEGVRFDGRLVVTDPDALLRALAAGIGPAKAFGFGLLSLAPSRPA